MGRFLGNKPRGADFLCHPHGRDWGRKEKEFIVFRTPCFDSDQRKLPVIGFASSPVLSLKRLVPAPSPQPTSGGSRQELPADVKGAEPRHVPTAWEQPANLINCGGCVHQLHGALCAHWARGGLLSPCALNVATAPFQRPRDISCPALPVPVSPWGSQPHSCPARGSRVLPCAAG